MLRRNEIICGDVMEVLGDIDSDSISCVITSPPYFACRDYKENGQIGLEDHPQSYIDKIVDVMRECKRVIRPDGSIFLNLGDSYYTKSGSGTGNNFKKRHEQLDGGRGELTKAHTKTRGKYKSNWTQHKQRLLIPYRVVIACQDELGLILRNDLTWVKSITNWKTKESWGSCMPSSSQDRFNTTSESIFFFVKNSRYFFDLNEVRVPHKEVSLERVKHDWDGHRKPMSSYEGMDVKKMCHPDGKNPGSCIMFPIEPSGEDHYATFPETLPEMFIRCASPEAICRKCGKSRIKLYDKEVREATKSNYNDGYGQSGLHWDEATKRTFIGYSDCGCKVGYEKSIILDPFCGSGTTLQMAMRLGRDFIGIDLSEAYCWLSQKSIEKVGNLFMNSEII